MLGYCFIVRWAVDIVWRMPAAWLDISAEAKSIHWNSGDLRFWALPCRESHLIGLSASFEVSVQPPAAWAWLGHALCSTCRMAFQSYRTGWPWLFFVLFPSSVVSCFCAMLSPDANAIQIQYKYMQCLEDQTYQLSHTCFSTERHRIEVQIYCWIRQGLNSAHL